MDEKDMAQHKIGVAASFIAAQHASYLARRPATSTRPMFLGIQGPQGSGKSFLAEALPEVLAHPPYRLSTAILSLDDLYSDHATLEELARKNPDNKLLHGRGQPGTHDLQLAESCFEALSSINDSSSSSVKEVQLPIYDKSKYDGKGDRSHETRSVRANVDLVIFEGWATGFMSVPDEQLEEQYAEAQRKPSQYARSHFGYDTPFLLRHSLDNLKQVNRLLKDYEQTMWRHIDAFLQLKPEKTSYVWKWRLEQEHAMKAKNGGKGMTDEQVEAFIARYMPGYECFLGGVSSAAAPWAGRGLQLILDTRRAVVEQTQF